MILQVYEAYQTGDGWVRGDPLNSPEEMVSKVMRIEVPEAMQDPGEIIRSELEKGFSQWSYFGSVEVIADSGINSIFSVIFARGRFYCMCLRVDE